jgi:C-terminal processing protease CtpA/Prc
MPFQQYKGIAMRQIRTRTAFLFCLLLALASAVPAQTPPDTLSAEQAAQDARILMRTVKALHPALTKYRTPAEMDAAFTRFEQRAAQARNAGAMYLAATELATSIRCGHTWTNVLNQDGAAKALLLSSSDKLPFTLKLIAKRWRVLASADPALSAGDEIEAINGDSATVIVNKMMPYLRADGSSDGKRLQQLNHDRSDYSQMDIVWPLISPPQNGQYRLAVRRVNGKRVEIAVAATTLAARESALAAQGIKRASEDWTLRIDGETAVLTLPTFSFWNSDFNWSAFIENAFADMQRKRVQNLIIDIRANEGGDGAIGGKILSYLIQQPLEFTSDQSTSAYERVPYNLARYLDTWDFGFFDRTGQVEKITTGTAAGKYRFLPNAAKRQVITPVQPHFTGKTYLLIGAENSSATFQFAQLSQQSGAAVLVGQRTGGNLRGLNGGQLAWVVLPNSGVAFDIPLLAATYSETTPDASIEPDVAVEQRFDTLGTAGDPEMQKVAELIKKHRKTK